MKDSLGYLIWLVPVANGILIYVSYLVSSFILRKRIEDNNQPQESWWLATLSGSPTIKQHSI